MATRATKLNPKLWQLTKSETVSSFENWKGCLLYSLSLDINFSDFLQDGFTWQKKAVDANRGLVEIKDEEENVIATSAQRVFLLNNFLGLIATYAPVISRNTIVRDCCSLKEIFQKLRAHYGFTLSGGSILDIVSLTRKSDESAEDVFQRYQSMIDNCLLSTTDDIEHHGESVLEDELLTPTLENLIVCLWLKTLHPALPQLVKQRFATQLRDCTLASIREDISGSIDELLSELGNRDIPSNSSVFQASSSYNRNQSFRGGFRSNNRFSPRRASDNNTTTSRNLRQQPSCPICKQAGRRNFQHFLSSCPFLPQEDKRFLSRARLIESLEEENDDCYQNFPNDLLENLPTQAQEDTNQYDFSQQNCRHIVHNEDSDQDGTSSGQVQQVSICSSPFINAFFNNHSVKIVLDTGATVNLINERLANFLHLKIQPSNQTAKQADGITNLPVIGETRFTLFRNEIPLRFEGLVINGLESEVLAGIPFLKSNDIAIRPSKSEIYIGDYRTCYNINESVVPPASVSRVYCSEAICQTDTTLYPSEFIDVRCNNTQLDSTVVLTPSKDSPWVDPHISHSVEGIIRITNTTHLPIPLKRSQCLASVTSLSDDNPILSVDSSTEVHDRAINKVSSSFEEIKFNPQNMNIDEIWSTKFATLHKKHSRVFNNDIPGYNGRFGAIKAFVNIGDSLPPQRRGKISIHAHYSQSCKISLTSWNIWEYSPHQNKPEHMPSTLIHHS